MRKDLISRSELLAEIDRERKRHIDSGNYGAEHLMVHSMRRLVEEVPAVDAAPVAHGRWVDNDIPESMLSGCSVCGFSCGAYTFNYCPNCGARMDKEE